MTRYKVNLVHFVEADDPDAAIAAAREPGREPIIGEAFVWGSDRPSQFADAALLKAPSTPEERTSRG